MSTHTNYNHFDIGILRHGFDEVTPMEFYRDIFGDGELDEADAMTPGKYCGIAVEVTNSTKSNGKTLVKRHTVTDDLDTIDALMYSQNFCLMSPISYVGKSRKSENARFMYALCIEVDSLRKTKKDEYAGLNDLIHQCSNGILPKPTYIVSSGNGVHLYYVFKKPVPLFQNVAKSIEKYKRYITKHMWNKYVTTLYKEEDIQYESIYQGFRMPGTLTKKGLATHNRDKTETKSNTDVVRAYKFDNAEKVSIEYMNSFVKKKGCDIVVLYKSDLTLAEAKKKYPNWYERRIVRKEEKGHWECKRDLYDWWKRTILESGAVGHRYYCLMMLAIYAIKCGSNVTQEELEQDCFEIMEHFEELTISDDNHFTEKDVMDALQAYEDKNFITYPVNSIAYRSGIEIKKNKRNGLKQSEHLEEARAIRDIRAKRKGKENWYDGGGRPKGSSKQKEEIIKWRKNNPDGKKADCIRALGFDKKTVYKWWNEPLEEIDPKYEELLDLFKRMDEEEE